MEARVAGKIEPQGKREVIRHLDYIARLFFLTELRKDQIDSSNSYKLGKRFANFAIEFSGYIKIETV